VERERLQALRDYRVVGSGPEPEIDAIAGLAARVAHASVGLVSFVDSRREWIKASVGADLEHAEGRATFGRAIVDSEEPLIVEDALADERFSGHPWVRDEPGLRFYAGVPLRAPGGVAIGTLAVLGPEPRSGADDLAATLTDFATLLMGQLEHRREQAIVGSLTCVVGYDGRFERVAPAWEQELGWKPGELIGRLVDEFTHPDDRARTDARVERLLSGHRTGPFENRFRTREGGYRWLVWHSRIVPRERRYYAVARDITDRKRNELALRESEARYRLLAENATDMIVGLELDGRITYVSSAAETLLGRRPDDVVGIDCYELIHPDDVAGVRALHDELIEHLQPVRGTYRVRGKDGVWTWVEGISRIVRDQRSRPVAMQSTVRDISETKRAVEALEAAREHFRRAFDDAPIGMAIVGADGAFERVNRALSAILGYSEDELAGVRPRDLLHPDDRGGEDEQIRSLREGERSSVAFEKRQVHKDGSWIWARVTVSAMHDEPGAGMRLLAHVEDVSERRRHADELQTAREDAEHANEAKSDFLSRMSHELRTPLNSVLGFAQLLQQDELSETQTESVDRIMSGGRHLLELVNDVLDIASIEARSLPVALERVSAGDVVKEALELLAPLAAAGQIELHRELSEVDILVAGNRQRLRQVLINLVSNAIKYSPPGADVFVAVERTPDMRCRLHVRDTGPGIPADQLERAFLPFERLSAGAGVEGTGLGLPLSRSLVQAMGGTLGVRSDSGGSTFTVELPLMAGDGGAGAIAASEALHALGEADADGTSGRRVLYIEDNASNVELVERMVDRDGDIDLVSARLGADGIALALSRPPDAVVLDLHLPDMSGMAVLEALRSHTRTASVPVIVVTADVTQDHEQTLIAAGATAYLTKPLDLARFRSELERALAHPQPTSL
jgi:PAS domain S-box-containing protein